MAVNLSPKQFRHSGFADRVIGIVREIGADPGRIHLEVTEGILLDDNDVTQEGVKTLRKLGSRSSLMTSAQVTLALVTFSGSRSIRSRSINRLSRIWNETGMALPSFKRLLIWHMQ